MTIDTITDPTDPRVAPYRDLRDPALRHDHNWFIAESTNVIRALLLARRYHVRSLLLTPSAHERLLPELAAHPVPEVLLASRELLTIITGVQLHRGGLALGERGTVASLEDVAAPTARRLVLLEDVANPDNTGGIFRTAHAFGVDGMILSPGCADPLYRKTVRVSMGTALRLPWTIDTQWPQSIAKLRAQGIVVAALTTSRTAIDLEALLARGVPDRLALLLGNEGTGLSTAARAAADFEVTIPMRGDVDSLNVAATAAIALHRLVPR